MLLLKLKFAEDDDSKVLFRFSVSKAIFHALKSTMEVSTYD